MIAEVLKPNRNTKHSNTIENKKDVSKIYKRATQQNIDNTWQDR